MMPYFGYPQVKLLSKLVLVTYQEDQRSYPVCALHKFVTALEMTLANPNS